MKPSPPAQNPPLDVPSTLKPAQCTTEIPSELISRHLHWGWWTLLVFLTMGLVLEALHGFKTGMYLRVSNETRRLMWTLAHAHGALLGLVNLGFASTLRLVPGWPASSRRLASGALKAATILMPAGFFLGGLFLHAGDPGLGILLVPPGGLLLFVSVALTGRALRYFRLD
ncbi:MAG TPA: hypothetical protein VHH73_19550 [Verrucomicrobiae bacterium]|nr:hypothetical protein [Verrucomicrobiae bacterium]